MHPRQRIAALKPQLARLDPRNRFAHGVLGAWLMNDDGGLRAIGAGATENYPDVIHDAGPYGAHVYELIGGEDEMRTVDSEWGQGVYFPAGNYGEFRNDWGKFWNGLTAISTFAICRNRTASQRTNILTAGLSGTSTTKFAFEFTFGNNLYYYSRAGTEGAQGVTSTQTFSANEWHVVGGSARVVNGGGVYKLYSDGAEIATTGTPFHSYDSYNGAFGTWDCRLGGLDYGQITWANIDIVFCMHWGWELTAADMASLAVSPYQAFHGPEVVRYADVFLGGSPVSYYLVDLPRNLGAQRVEGVKTMIVDAASEEIAKNIAASRFEGDSDWGSANATLLEPAVNAYDGATFRVKITGKPVPSPDLVDVSYTAATTDALADVAEGIVAALNATKQLTAANWSSPNITIPGATEGLGDRRVVVEITPKGAASPITWTDGLPVKSITHGGSSGDDLTIEMADTGMPRILA
jgi:hypothetical protein